MLNKTEFSEEFARRLIQKFNGLKIVSIDNFEIQTEFKNSDNYKYFLDNCYSEYLREPTEIEKIIKKYLNSASDLYMSKETLQISNILPVIKDKRFIQSMKEITLNFEENHEYERYNDDLFIFYIQDTETNINYLKQDDLKKLKIEKIDLKKIAIKNLYNLIKIEKYEDNGFYMLVADGNYESSLILLDIWSKENFEVNGEIVIGIPSRDLLIITGKNDTQNIERLKKTVIEINDSGDHLVSQKLFEYRNGKFETI